METIDNHTGEKDINQHSLDDYGTSSRSVEWNKIFPDPVVLYEMMKDKSDAAYQLIGYGSDRVLAEFEHHFNRLNEDDRKTVRNTFVG